MRHALLPLLLSGCVAPQVASQAPAPIDFELRVGDPSPGSITTWHLLGAPPNGRAFLVASKGTAGVGDCPPQLGGRCMDITPGTSGYVFLDNAVVGADGRLSRQLVVPAGYQDGGTWALQAVVFGGGGVAQSNPELVDVLDRFCPDDGFEDNDDVPSSVRVEPGQLTDLLSCDNDVWAVRVDPGEGLEATLTYDPANLDGSVSIRINNGFPGGGTDFPGFQQTAVVNDGTGPTTAHVTVGSSDRGDTPFYDLEIRTFVLEPCIVDAFEDDDSLFDATLLLGDETAEAVACDGDNDTFAFQALAGQRIGVDFTRPDTAGEFNAQLLDPVGNVLRTADRVQDGAQLDSIAQADGTYFEVVDGIRDDAYGGGVPYTVTPYAYTRVSCGTDALEPNDEPLAAPSLLPLRYDGLMICDDTVDLYRLPLRANQTATLSVLFDHDDGDVDLRLLDATGALLDASGSTTDDETVTHTASADEVVLLEVTLFADAGPPTDNGNVYALDIALGPVGAPAPCPGDADSDRDGTCDAVDTCLGDDGTGDTDGDGLCDDLEALLGTGPTDTDSDDDGQPDGVEARSGTDPTRPDSNGDGVCDGDRADNDGDGVDPVDPCVDRGGWAAFDLGGPSGCALRDAGTLSCWGRDRGLLSPPTGRFTEVAVGLLHACALDAAGAVQCWGENGSDQLAAPSGRYTGLTAGGFHTCALDAVTSEVVCWGGNFDGFYNTPVGAFVQLDAGYDHTCGIRASGALRCWGKNGNGQSSGVPSGTDWFQVVAGNFHSCAIDTAGALACWGIDDGSGQDVGQVTQAPNTRFQQLSAGDYHTCGVAASGQAVCWGGNDSGQLNAPPQTFTRVDASFTDGTENSCGLDATTGELVCWGADDQGQSQPPGL